MAERCRMDAELVRQKASILRDAADACRSHVLRDSPPTQLNSEIWWEKLSSSIRNNCRFWHVLRFLLLFRDDITWKIAFCACQLRHVEEVISLFEKEELTVEEFYEQLV